MSKLFTYFPILCFLIILFTLDQSVLKVVLFVIIAILVIIAKYFRKRMDEEEVEYDDRVNANITKWSLRSVYIMNALLFLLFITEKNGLLSLPLNTSFVLIYLLLTLFIPFYIIPSIIKKF
ncbi:hypothetical protein LRR81_07805 [Metabacillus sp. GX 13764]|uniref:hypothetical protein n=1 Tax=Metabacillus kandeliae TaxID=2900151 RepID=UPI001E354F6D|nr:hypothetical protein [Metabacillus kandeliae]MCD7034135.1 hypothetical protein [Metabacillus kandeliae]